VEAASQRTLGQGLGRSILGPLGLRDTQLPDSAPEIPGPSARGYSLPPGPHGKALDGPLLGNAGVGGFLPKTVSAHVLADVVRAVHDGGRYVDPELAAEAIRAGDSPLTPREADVLELAADGVAVEEIAHRASPGTVRNYLSSAASKLGAANRHEAVHLARTHGWI
jgi:DNA-binding CsgD family transcriptional regulator